MQKFILKLCLIFALLLMSLLPTGCSTTRSHQILGESASISPGRSQLSKSANDAVFDPGTWVPLAAAILIAVTNSDSKIQNWASENNPIFGSQENAKKYSDGLVTASAICYFTSLALTPDDDQVSSWLANKTKGLAVGGAAMLSTQIVTQSIKSTSDRERPDGSDTRSFPSGHTSTSAVNVALTNRNLEYFYFDPPIENSLKIGMNTLTLATGWARIEADKHYPIDILMGAALGNFFGVFFNDSFLGRFSNDINLTSNISLNNVYLNLRIRF
jgi:membrane-associated phospholipid phosphatase